MNGKLTSRKFWLCAGVTAGIFALRIADKLSEGNFITVVMAIVGGYILGNVLSKFANNK